MKRIAVIVAILLLIAGSMDAQPRRQRVRRSHVRQHRTYRTRAHRGPHRAHVRYAQSRHRHKGVRPIRRVDSRPARR